MNPAFQSLDLKERSIIVTGGASGIGRATALLLASRGASVTVVDLDEAGGRTVVSDVEQAGGKAQFFRADVSVEADAIAMVEAAVGAFGGLHGAFNNAGIIGSRGTILGLTTSDWERTIRVNLTGTYNSLKAELAYLVENQGGSIVNTVSTAGVVAYPKNAAYVASKHAALGLTRQVAIDFAQSGVRVNAVLPGPTMTPLAAQAMSDPAIRKIAEEGQPIGRMGEPHEIAELAAWLLSDASSFCVGAAFTADGGATAI